MYSHSISMHQKLKAAILLLCLGLMMVGSCPIQKYLSSTFAVKVEGTKQPSLAVSLAKNEVRCAEYKEAVPVPLIEQSAQSKIPHAWFILLACALLYGLKPFGRNAIALGIPEKEPSGTAIPLFLRYQVFRI